MGRHYQHEQVVAYPPDRAVQVAGDPVRVDKGGRHGGGSYGLGLLGEVGLELSG